MSFPRFVRNRQPQIPVSADYPGLIYVWTPATDTLAKSGTITRAHTSNGMAVVTASSAYEFMNSAPQFSLDACSILSILTPKDVTAAASTYAVACGSSSSVRPLFMIGQGASTSQLSFRTRDSENTDIATSGTSPEWASGKTSVCIGVRSKSLATQRVFANGKQIASSAVGTAAATTFDRFAIGCLLRSTAALHWAGKTGLVAVFNRKLSDAEIKSLSDNPWQIFQPAARAIWVPVGAAGGASNAPRYFHRTQSGQA